MYKPKKTYDKPYYKKKAPEIDYQAESIYASLSEPEVIQISENNDLPTPSDEQQEIINYFVKGYNIKVEAVAGSGKSTTLLHLALKAKEVFKSKSLILTYNKDLQTETKERIFKAGLQHHCDVYTYHGYASKIYRTGIHNDVILRRHLENDPINITDHSIILLDEVQDMNRDYHTLVSKILRHSNILILVGDRRQCINEYIDASSDYLTFHEKYFDTGRPWKELLLRTSYRMTPSIANFINKNIIKEDLIIGGNIKNIDRKPIYNYDSWEMGTLIVKLVKLYGPEEVVILRPSTKNIPIKSPLGKLMNAKMLGIKFCVREDESLSDEQLKDKVLISSFNSFKGLERMCIIVYSYDESYFEYYDKKWPKENKLLPNILYVASSRAKSCLVLVQDKSKTPFRTTNKDIIRETCNVIGEQTDIKPGAKNPKQKFNVTDITKHRSTTDMIDLLDLMKVTVIQPQLQDPLPYEKLISFGGYYEDMRKYYGTIVPLLCEFKLKGASCLCNCPMPIPTQENGMSEPPDVVMKFNHLTTKDNKNLNEWMELVVINHALLSGHYFYVDQIKNYDWVDQNFIFQSVNRILDVIKDTNGYFEVPTTINKSPPADVIKALKLQDKKFFKYNLSGSIDYLSETHIWEFKGATSLNDDHKIQCGAYISLLCLEKNNKLPCKLFNFRTCELIEITVDNPEEFIEVLMRKC